MSSETGWAWARRTDDGWVLELRIQPGARRSEVVGPLGDALKLKVAAPADDGKANAELVRFLAGRFGVSRGSIRILRGQTNRTKSVLVTGSITPATLLISPLR